MENVETNSNILDWREVVVDEHPGEMHQDDVIDMVLDAYTTGKKKGFEEATKTFEVKALMKAFELNLERATGIVAGAIKKIITELSIDIDGLFLKIESMESFDVAIILPLETYVSTGRRKVTKILMDLEATNCDDTFGISFTVIPSKDGLDVYKLFVNGYTLRNEKYKAKGNQA